MSCLRSTLLCLVAFCAVGSLTAQGNDAAPLKVTSPNGQIVFLLFDSQTGKGTAEALAGLRYAVEFHGKPLLAESPLGLDVAGQPALGPGMRNSGAQTGSVDQSYTIPVGKTSTVRDHYNFLRADYQDATGRKLTIEVRVFDDGAAFRYAVPEQAAMQQVKIARENTEFTYAKDATTYPLVLEGYQSSWEDEYQERLVSGLHHDWLVGLPLLAEEPGVGWVAITEADIDNYAGMYLRKGPGRFEVKADLSPRVDDAAVAVETKTPFNTPWRVLMIGDEPGRLIESNIVLNLNPPSKIADTSWIQAGKASWDWWSGQAAPSVSFKTGMNTATMKHYIDFASTSGFPYMLIDAGWAVAPARTGPEDYSELADITRIVPDVDMPELLRYA